MDDKLTLLIRSGNPLISVETTDEQRAEEVVRRVAWQMAQPLFEWSMTTGLRPITQTGTAEPVVAAGKATAALSFIRDSAGSGLYLLKDMGPHCKDALVHRMLRDLCNRFAHENSAIIMVDALPLPDEIKRFTLRFEIGWPDIDELEQIARETFRAVRDKSLTKVTAQITKRQMEQLVQTLRGLSREEAARVVSAAVYDDYCLNADDLHRIVEAKRTLLGSTGCLESVSAEISTDQIGGLENLKAWLARRRGGFSRQAREFGLAPPRGVLMLGVPGCGKSLCAKVIAADWNMPLLRLDPGVLYQKYIGETESQLRRALAQAEAMAPTVLWIDEVE